MLDALVWLLKPMQLNQEQIPQPIQNSQMFSPVVPESPLLSRSGGSAAPVTASQLQRASSKRLSSLHLRVDTSDGNKNGNGNGNGNDNTSPRGDLGSRRLSSKRLSTKSLLSVPDARQRPSIVTRRMTARNNSTTSLKRKEIPPHLLKLLQKTPESKARVDAVKLMLSEQPSFRNEANLDLLYDWMLQNCKQYSNNIFGSAPEYIRREICRQMRLMKTSSNHLLIRQGDTGDRCYIVVDGLVDVYIKKKDTVAPQPTDDSPSSSSTPVNPMAEYGDMVANLGPGAMFGEVVLLNPSARRNATIVASQYTDTCELICLERADYIRLVRGASMEASHYNQAEILDQMFLFHGWEKNDKMKLVSAMRSLHFTSNDYLYRAGAEAKWMYIITSGEVVERVNWTMGKSISNGNNLTGNSMIATTSTTSNLFASFSSSANESNSSPAKTNGGATAAATATATAFSSSSSTSQRDQPEAKVSIDLLLVGMGDVVGEFPFLRNKLSVLFDIKAVSDVHALALDRRTFETMILHANAETHAANHATLLKLQKLTEERDDWRQQRLSCGALYPNAHISITWPLMRMSMLRCPRCGQRGHLASDTRRCALPASPRRQTGIAGSIAKSKSKPGSSVQLPPLSVLASPSPSSAAQQQQQQQQGQQHHKKMTLIGSISGHAPTHDVGIRDLLDETYLPSAREQLRQCRLDAKRQQPTTHPPMPCEQ